MSNNIQQQTTANIQEKANLIWAIADKLVGVYKPHEYGNVILPMCIIKRFEDTLDADQFGTYKFDYIISNPPFGIEWKKSKKAVEDEHKLWVVTKNKSSKRQGKVQLIDASGCFEKRRKSLGNKRVEITDSCRDLIMEAYKDFTNWEYVSDNGEQKVESKVLDNEHFKFSKLTIERPLLDDNGKIVLKNKKPQANPKLRDTEIIPWLTDTDEYLDKNVRPYAPDFFVDESKTKIGYEIPFTREFYKYVAPRKSSEIFAHLKELETAEIELMSKILG